MIWPLLATTTTVFYYLLLPFKTILSWLFLPLSPVVYLGSHMLAGLLLPLKLIVKLETLYIYLGVAAVIGLLTGSVLHLSSSILVSLFNLTTVPEDPGCSQASVRAPREQKKLEEAWQSSPSKGDPNKSKFDTSMQKKYAEWLEKDVRKRRTGQGVLGQTIIEEDDDSDDVF